MVAREQMLVCWCARRLGVAALGAGTALHAAIDAGADGTDGAAAACARAIEQLALRWPSVPAPDARELVALVSGRWLGLASLPWSDALLTGDGTLLHARSVVQAQGRELHPGDELHVDARPGYREPRAAVAVAGWLRAALLALARATALRLAAVQPLSLVAAHWLARRPGERAPLVGVIDGEALVLVGRPASAPDPWHVLVDAQLPADPLGRAAVLWRRARIRLPALERIGRLPLTSVDHALVPHAQAPELAPLALPAAWPSILGGHAAAGAAVNAAPPRRRAQACLWPAAAALCVAGSGVLATQAWRWEHDAERLALPPAGDTAPPAAPASHELQAEIRAVNAAVAQINLPLDDVLRELQPPRDLPVTVLSLDIEGFPGTPIRLGGEAASGADMTRYVDFLAGRARIASSRLTRHEVDGARPGQPYRFVVEFTWRP